MRKIILASASPRRKELLEQCGVSPEIITSNIEESIFSNKSPEEIVMSLSFQKAINVAMKVEEGLVIGADTIVALDNEILGKPSDSSEAFSILKKLSGKEHKVVTGFSIIDKVTGKKVVDYESTKVYFRKLSDYDIQEYLATEETKDKAGAYGIQGKGALLVEKIEGCYFNVVGLPISKLNNCLRVFFNTNLLQRRGFFNGNG